MAGSFDGTVGFSGVARRVSVLTAAPLAERVYGPFEWLFAAAWY